MRVLPIDEMDRRLNRGGNLSLHLNGSSRPMEEPEGEASSQGNLVWTRASEAVRWDKAWVEAGKRFGRTFAITARYLDFIQSAMESLKDRAHNWFWLNTFASGTWTIRSPLKSLMGEISLAENKFSSHFHWSKGCCRNISPQCWIFSCHSQLLGSPWIKKDAAMQ